MLSERVRQGGWLAPGEQTHRPGVPAKRPHAAYGTGAARTIRRSVGSHALDPGRVLHATVTIALQRDSLPNMLSPSLSR